MLGAASTAWLSLATAGVPRSWPPTVTLAILAVIEATLPGAHGNFNFTEANLSDVTVEEL